MLAHRAYGSDGIENSGYAPFRYLHVHRMLLMNASNKNYELKLDCFHPQCFAVVAVVHLL